MLKPLLVFSFIAFFSWLIKAPLHPLNENLIAFLYFFRWLVYASVFFLFSIKRKWLVRTGLGVAIIGLIQYFFFPDMRFLANYGWDDHYYRLIFPFLDPAFTGLILSLTLILMTQKFWQKRFSLYSLFSIVYLALALTYSRSSYLAFLVGMTVISRQKKSWQLFLISLVLLLATVFLLPQPGGEGVNLLRTSTIEARIQNYQHTWQIIKDQPFLGVGFNFYRYAQRDYGFLGENWQINHAGAGADSSLMFVWATTGIFGLIAYLWLLKTMLKVEAASLWAVIIHSFFNNSLFYSWVMLWLWLLLSTQKKKKESILFQ